MIRALLLTLLALTACATPLSLPPPSSVDGRAVTWEQAYLPAGVLAEADLETQTITLAPAWQALPDSVRVFVVAHELCHLRGHVTEGAADCCAARDMGAFYGAGAVLDAAIWLQARGRDVSPIVECVP